MKCAISRRSILLGAASVAIAGRAVGEDAPEKASAVPPMLPSEQLLHSTALIETFDSGGVRSSGTGFFFTFFKHGGTEVGSLITNKHVLQNATTIFATFTRRNKDGRPQFGKTKRIQLHNWLAHPDQNVDLAMIALGPEFSSLADLDDGFMMVACEPHTVPTDQQLNDFLPLEDVLVVGYPDGISDTINNVPVFRRGITATPVYLDFQGLPIFLLDAAIFPGSSGSPVFLFNQGTWAARDGNVRMGTRLALLGVVFAVAQHKSDGKVVIKPAPTQANSSVETLIPNNVGLCVKASKVLDFEPIMIKRGLVNVPEGYDVRSKYKVPD